MPPLSEEKPTPVSYVPVVRLKIRSVLPPCCRQDSPHRFAGDSFKVEKRCRLLIRIHNETLTIVAMRVRDYRLGYQHARRTHIIAAFNFLHHIFANDFQQAFFAFGHSPWLDIENAKRANRKVIAAERNARVKAQAALF